MNQTHNVTANFTFANYPLTIVKTGSGTVTISPGGIDCDAGCSATFVDGTSVTLDVAAAPGWQISGISEGPHSVTDGIDNLKVTTLLAGHFPFMANWSGTLPMKEAKTVTVIFAPLISNVRASQRPGTQLMDIYYDLYAPSYGSVSVSVLGSEDGGANFSIAPAATSLSGGLGQGIVSGSHQITWDLSQTFPANYFNPNFAVQVLATVDNVSIPGESSPFAVNLLGANGGLSFSGSVLDGASGAAVAGAQIQLGADSTTSDAQGAFNFASIPAGNYTLIISKAGYVPVSYPVSITPGGSLSRLVTLSPANSPSAVPMVTSVTSKYPGLPYFLDGIPFNVEFTANVAWGNHPPGIVRFITPKGGVTDVLTSGTTASQQIDVGSAFGPGGQVQVTAISSDGSQSVANVPGFVVMEAIPSVLLQVVDMGTSFSYQSSLAPNFQFINAGLPGGVTIDSSIPLFGDNPFNLSFLPSLNISVNGNHADYELDDNGSGIPELDVAGQEMDFTPQLQAFGNYDASGGQWNWGGSLGLNANLDVSKSWPFIVTLGPVPVPMFAKADLDLSANTTLNVVNLYPTTLNGTLELDPQVTGTLGVGVDSVVNIAGWIGGGTDFTFQYPMTPPLQHYSIHLDAGVSAYAFGFSWQNQLFGWNWPENATSQTPNLLTSGKAILPQPYLRSYLSKPSYAAFDGGLNPRFRRLGSQDSGQNPRLYPLQSDIFPFSESSISADGTNCYSVWLYDNPNRSLNNRTMLVFSGFDGTNWSAPGPVADDGTADFHPQLRTFADGSAVVAWENENTTLSTNADFSAMVTNLEIATAFYNPAARAWQPMEQLTTNGYLDRSPRIAGPSETNLMLVWVANTNNDLQGSITNANQLFFATWNGSVWSAPQSFASVPYPLLKYDMVYNGTNAYVVLSLDADNTLTNVNAHELFEIVYQNGAWGALQQLTTDQVPNDNPQMAIDPNGHIVLSWLKGTGLTSLVDFNFAAPKSIGTNDYSSNLADFKLTKSGDGRLAIIWAAPSQPYSSDLWGIFYDPNFEIWASPRQLTADPETEMEIAATFYGTNQLIALYDRVDIPIVNTDQTSPVITNADLYALQYQITDDLALIANSLASSPANPAPGDAVTLSVTMENLGDAAVSNVSVVFYDGDPASGGVEIGETNLTALLAPGATNVAAIPWTIPITTNSLAVYAVIDPDHLFSDSDLLNNEVHCTLVEPDLKVQSVTWSQITSNLFSITATVVNQGTIASQPAIVSFPLNSSTGASLFSTNIASLAPGESVDVNFVWNAPNSANGSSFFALINTGTNANFNLQDEIMEATIQENSTAVNAVLGPVVLQSNGVLQVGMTGLAGQTYLVQASTDLFHWSAITTVSLTNGTGQFTDPISAGVPQRFYRTVVFSQIQPQMGPLRLISGNVKQVTVKGLPGQSYIVEASTDLVNWVALTNVVLPNSAWQFADPSTNFDHRFYRAILP